MQTLTRRLAENHTVRRLTSPLRPWGFYVFSLCLSLLAYDVFYGFWDHDGGYYLLQSSLVAQGLKPWIDYLTLYPPVMALINAGFLKLGFSPRILIWALPLFWASAVAFASTFYLRRKGWNTQRALAAGSVYLLFCVDFGGNHVTLEHGVALFGILALGVSSFFWAGVFLACAIGSKQVAILLLIPFLFRLRNWQQIRRFCAGLAVPALLVLGWLNFNVALIVKNQLLVQSYLAQALEVSDSHSGFGKLWILVKRDFFASPGFEFFFLFLISVAIATSVQLLRRKKHREGLEWTAWLLVGLVFQAARAVKPFPHYALALWPAALVLWVGIAPRVKTTAFLRRSAWATGVAALLVLSLGSRVKTFSGKSYWKRWDHASVLLDFVYPVSRAVSEWIPAGNEPLFLGNEESSLLYLANRLPLNKDWGSMVPEALPSLSVPNVIVVGQGSPEVDRLLAQLRSQNYTRVGEWPAPAGNPQIAVSVFHWNERPSSK